MEWRRKAIGVHTGFRACWLMVACIWLENQAVEGQRVSLSAGGTGQSTPITVTFGDGQPTADVTDYLPVCVVISGSGPFIRLEKTDGSLVLAETGAFSQLSVTQLNFTIHPLLDTSYTGLYHCRTANRNSTQTYQLNIVAQQVHTAPSPTSLTFTNTGATHNIPCMSSGNFPLKASWSSTLSPDSQMIQTTMPATMVNSTFSFQQNNSQIVFTESDTSGVTFNVTCTTSYTTNFDCIGMGSSPPRPQSVIDRCVNATQAISTTVSVTIQALCPDLTDSGFNYKPIPGFSRQPAGTPVPIECRTGFLSNNSMEITQSTCQGNGRWQPSPPLCESCSMVCNNASVTSCARITVSNIQGINCPCNSIDEIWTRSAQDCVPTHCPAQEGNSLLDDIPRLEVNNSMYVACNDNYTSTEKGRNVTCMLNGTLSNLPNCTVNSTPGSTPGSTTGSTRESCTTTSAENQTQTSYTLGSVIGGVVGGIFFGVIATMVVVTITNRKKQSKLIQPEVPSQTQNAACEDADVAESSLTKSDAYGVVESAPQPQYEFVCPQ
ncbi:mucin-3A-like [Sycon ciliatum]|uniref:mucin-3A-like n=1 Tax=Sycon ciliatum TaxID=27933 RepID=UPI0031F6CC6B